MQKDLPTGFAVGIGLMLILPLLNYLRDAPIGDFYGEWLSAVAFAVAIVFLLPRLSARTDTSLTLLLVPAAAGAVMLLQAATGRIVYAYDWITWTAYLTLLLLAYLLGQALRGEQLVAEATNRLASALLVAGLVNLAAQLIQVASYDKALAPFIVPLPEEYCRATGNVGQANQATLLAWMAAVGALYLHGVGRLRGGIAAALVACMLLSSVLTFSRMAWVFLALAVFPVLAMRAWPAPTARRRWAIAALLAIGFVLAIGLATAVLEQLRPACATVSARLADGSDGGLLIRLLLWRQAIEVWLSSPWLGAGVGLFMAAVYRVQPLGTHQPLDYYAHNVWLQILAELGIFVALAIVVVIVRWLVGLFRLRATLQAPDSILMYWLALLAAHSAIEFPLYYVHFLVMFGLCSGLVVRPEVSAPAARLPLRALTGFLAVVVAAGCALAVIDYRRLDRVTHLVTLMMANNFGLSPEVEQILGDARRDVFVYEPMADHAVQLLTPLTADGLDEKIEATERLLNKSPVTPAILRRIALAAIDGDDETALWHARRLMMFFPRSAPELLSELQGRLEAKPEARQRIERVAELALAERPPLRWRSGVPVAATAAP